MGKMKKILIAVLSVMLLLSTAGLMACNGAGGFEIKTKTTNVKYYVGYNVDMFDLFVQEGGVRYTFTVSKDGGEAEATGRQYFANEAGEYTAICTATINGKSISKDTTFTVYDSVPYMVVAKNNIVVDWMAKASLSNIFAYSQARIIADSAYEQVIDYVLVYDNEDGTGRKVDLSIGNASGDGMWDGRKAFQFTFEGDYDFHIMAKSTGGASESTLRVTALENYSEYAEIDMGLTVDEVAGTAKWKAASGAVSYRVKIGTKSLKTDQTELVLTDYLTKEFSNFDLVIIAVDANGDVIGKQVKKQVVIAPAGYEGIVLSSGAKVDTTTDTVNIIPASCTIHSVAGVSKSDVHYLAYRGEYGVGYYVDFYFTGNNLPQVCLFANDLSTNLTNSEGGKGILIMNGMYSNNTPDLLFNSLRAFGPNRLDEPYNHSKLFVLLDTQGYEQFSKNYLQKDENANNKYKYVVGTEETEHGTITVALQLWTVDKDGNEELLYLVNKDTGIKTEELPAGNIVAYGAMAGPKVDTTFTFCKKPYSYQEDGIKSSGAIFTTDGEVWLAGKVLGSSAQPFTIIPSATNSAGTLAMGMSNSFVGLEGSYGVGTYMDIYFTGNNMPEVMFFADEINGNMSGYSSYVHADPYLATANEAKGVLISNGMLGGNTNNDINEYFTIWGPNRIRFADDTKLNQAFVTYLNHALLSIKSDDATYGIFTQDALSDEKYKDTQFKYTIGTYEVSGHLGIHAILYMIEDGNEVKLAELIQETKVATTDVSAGGIVLYGTVKGENELTKFRYSDPYESNPPYLSSGASVAEDGTITTTGNQTGNRMYDLANVSNSYYALNGKYGVGTYVDAYFTGNNMPEIMLFSDVISGNMTGFATYDYVTGSGDWTNFTLNDNKGLLFSNGFAGGANDNGAPDKYIVWGMGRVYSETGLAGGFRDALGGALKVYDKTTEEAKILSQLSLAANYADTQFKYTVGTYADGEKLAIEVILANAVTEEELIHIAFTTDIAVADVEDGSIIFYDTLKGKGTTTVFKIGEPYTYGEEGHVHDYKTLKHNSVQHWYECDCGKWQSKVNHSGGTANCTNKATCDICGETYGDYAHDFKTLKSDDDYHWYECDCGAKSEKVSHSGGIATTTEKAKCGVCGTPYGELIPEGTITTNRATENADGTYTLEGGASLSEGASEICKVDTGYVAIQGSYSVGYFMDFEFTGNNLPQVTFFANEITGNVTAHNGAAIDSSKKGLFITNGMYITRPNGSYTSMYYNTNIFCGADLTAYGPNKINNNVITMHQNGSAHVMSTDSLLTYKGLEGDTSGKTYIYKVGTILDETDNTVMACAELYDKATGNLLVTSYVDTGIAQKDLPAGSIIAYAGIKGADVTTTFKLVGKPYVGSIKYMAYGATFADDGTVTLAGRSLKGSGQPFGLITSNANYAANGDKPISYLGLTGKYGVGTYMDFYFTGNNMPEVMFFADVIDDQMTGYATWENSNSTDNGRKGVLISNGIHSTNEANDINHAFTVWGPNRIYFGSGAACNGVFYGFLKYAEVSITDGSLLIQETLAKEEYANTEFKYTVGTYEKDGKLVVKVILGVKEEGAYVTKIEKDLETSIEVSALTAGNIVIYDSIKGSDTVFKYTAPYTMTDEQ